MKIVVVGASGVLGRAMLAHLRSHEVIGTTRSPDKLPVLAALGARGVICDVYAPGALRAAMIAAAPDVVVNVLTDLAGGIGPGNARIRSVGGPIVVDAARAAGARRLLVESIAFPTTPASDAAVAALEDGACTSGLEAVVLRFGRFWGPGTWSEAGPAEPPTVHVDVAGRRAVELIDAVPGVYTISDP